MREGEEKKVEGKRKRKKIKGEFKISNLRKAKTREKKK